MNKFWWVAVEKMNLETKIIWRQVLIGPKFDPKNFFPPQDHNYLLDILFFCWNMQNQRNLMIQTWITDQKPHIWATLSQTFFLKFGLRHFFFDLLKTSLMQKIKEILCTVSERNSPHERTNFWWVQKCIFSDFSSSDSRVMLCNHNNEALGVLDTNFACCLFTSLLIF